MKIIVDAYNVLYYLCATDRITDGQRKAFIKRLGIYARQKGHDLVAVFDGGPVLFSSCARVNGIIVCYSGSRMSADEFILKYIKQHVGRAMLLVSSDRELCKAARCSQVESVTVQDFCNMFKQKADQPNTSPPGPAVKMGGSSLMIDVLMMQTEVPLKAENDRYCEESRNRKSDKLSKKERNRMHKLKKL